jgi:hypothetical protein
MKHTMKSKSCINKLNLNDIKTQYSVIVAVSDKR